MSIYLTGDTHGDISRLIADPLYKNETITEKDVIIVLGDFGVIFNPSETEREIKSLYELERRPNKFLFIDGNHENHNRLNKLNTTTLFGGKVGIVRKDKIYHCKRGEIFIIDDLKFFVFGGATSIDKMSRLIDISWWEQEVASVKEMNHGMDMLEKHNFKVDYILAHTAPSNIVRNLKDRKELYDLYDPDPTRSYLEFVCERTNFKKFYCGHWHVDYKIKKYNFLFKNMVKIL
jgi:hypothetical protein